MSNDVEEDTPADDPVDAVDAPDPVNAPAEPLPPRRLGIVAAVGVSVLLVDQVSKWWAVNELQDYRVIELIGSLQLNLVYNPGVAFSMGANSSLGPWIAVLAIGVVVAVSFGTTSRFPLGAVASGLIAGGALGNLLDRAFRGDKGFLHGSVIDFINLQWWPVFNVADAAVVVGAILLVIASFRVPS